MASVNYVTAHDGFTLRDLVSYESRHNGANGETNRDGSDDNRSSNGGVEGDTDDVAVQKARARRQHNLLATLLLSHGVPMLLAGDELGRSQRGNNNAYCQDNETSWLSWTDVDRDLLRFVRYLAGFRAAHPALRRRSWFTGRPLCGAGATDIAWLGRDGRPIAPGDWDTGPTDLLAMFLNGAQLGPCDLCGEPIVDDDLLLVLNGGGPTILTVPDSGYAPSWRVGLTTAPDEVVGRAAASAHVRVPADSVSVLVHHRRRASHARHVASPDLRPTSGRRSWEPGYR
jgi:glycogen operon protein